MQLAPRLKGVTGTAVYWGPDALADIDEFTSQSVITHMIGDRPSGCTRR